MSEMFDGKAKFIPNPWARLMLESANRHLSPEQFNDLLLALSPDDLPLPIPEPEDAMKKEFTFAQVVKMQRLLRGMVGEDQTREIATQAGEAIVEDSVAKADKAIKATQMAMRLARGKKKVKLGLEFFSKFFDSISEQTIKLSEDDYAWYWRVSDCAECWQGQGVASDCGVNAGIVTGVLKWISPDTHISVDEAECLSDGGQACTFAISKSMV